jgi:hypothetical protein
MPLQGTPKQRNRHTLRCFHDLAGPQSGTRLATEVLAAIAQTLYVFVPVSRRQDAMMETGRGADFASRFESIDSKTRVPGARRQGSCISDLEALIALILSADWFLV